MTTTDTPVVRVRGAYAAYPERPVLCGVDLDVRSSEVVALLGANGSGKSTLVRAVVGLGSLTAGTIDLFGTPLPRFRDWSRIGYVPQRLAVTSGVPATVREVVTSGRLTRGGLFRRTQRSDREAVLRALETVGLADRAGDSLSELSGGQQRRALIARALAGEPDILILDEPTAGVDLPSQQAFADALRLLVERGTTILLVAHELGPLEPLIDRAVVLRHGEVVHDGPPPSVIGPPFAHPGHEHPHGGEHAAQTISGMGLLR
jgi:zinc transport system ATP-binding protein